MSRHDPLAECRARRTKPRWAARPQRTTPGSSTTGVPRPRLKAAIPELIARRCATSGTSSTTGRGPPVSHMAPEAAKLEHGTPVPVRALERLGLDLCAGRGGKPDQREPGHVIDGARPAKLAQHGPTVQ